MSQTEKKSIVKQETYIEKNFNTGEEITKTVNITARFSNEPRYIKLYSKDFAYLNSLTKGEILILFSLLKRVDFATNGMEIVLNQTIKSRMLKETNLKNIGSINNALTKFLKIGLFKRPYREDCNISSSILIPNPYFFGKGDWADIASMREFFSPNIIQIHKRAVTKNIKIIKNEINENNISDKEEALYSRIQNKLQSIKIYLENLSSDDEDEVNEATDIIAGYLIDFFELTKKYSLFTEDILPKDEKQKITKILRFLSDSKKIEKLLNTHGFSIKWTNSCLKFYHS